MFFIFALAALSATTGTPIHENEPLSALQIYGGRDADIKDYPWQISLLYRDLPFCGGFLISEAWVVTAAHCIVDGFDTDLNIRAGSSYSTRGGQSVAVNRSIVHPQYNKNGQLNNDIALLQLESPVSFDESVRAARLPVADEEIANGSFVNITGWGTTETEGSSEVLQAVSVPSIDRIVCRQAYSESLITDHMFCAGLLGVGGKDACQGDSGGPVSIGDEVVGIVSWGYTCADPDHPGVYARVSSFRKWIAQTSGI